VKVHYYTLILNNVLCLIHHIITIVALASARQWKLHMLFAVLQIIESTGFAKRLSDNDQCYSE